MTGDVNFQFHKMSDLNFMFVDDFFQKIRTRHSSSIELKVDIIILMYLVHAHNVFEASVLF